MKRKQNRSWLDILADFVTAHPKMSAAIAFQLGTLAAQAATGAPKAYRDYQRNGFAAASGRVMDSLPDTQPFTELKSLMGPTKPVRRKRTVKSRKARSSKARNSKAGAAAAS